MLLNAKNPYEIVSRLIMTMGFVFLLWGCNQVTESDKSKIASIVTAQAPMFESEAKESIKADQRINKLVDGKWDWEYENGSNGRILAKFGYRGDLPAWKAFMQGFLVGSFADKIFDNPRFIYRTLEVNLSTDSVKLVDNPD
jgi:hypothetical protein